MEQGRLGKQATLYCLGLAPNCNLET